MHTRVLASWGCVESLLVETFLGQDEIQGQLPLQLPQKLQLQLQLDPTLHQQLNLQLQLQLQLQRRTTGIYSTQRRDDPQQ